jgi:DNA-binding GntR family transcriptional regulator
MTGPAMRGASDTAAYREIKSRILDLRYPPGEKLSETRLCAELGVGRSPVRAALARLKEEGWISVAPQSGTYVRSLSPKDIEEVIELRLLLEMHLARMAAQRIAGAEVARLQTALATLKPRVVKGGLVEFRELDDRIHTAIYTASGNATISALLLSLREKVRWVLPTTATPLELRHALQELERIVAALEARDPDAAGRCMGEHVGSGGTFYKKFSDISSGWYRLRKPDDAPATKNLDHTKRRRAAS